MLFLAGASGLWTNTCFLVSFQKLNEVVEDKFLIFVMSFLGGMSSGC